MARVFEATTGGVIIYGNRRMPRGSVELEFSVDDLKVTIVHKDNLFTPATYAIDTLTTALGTPYLKATLEIAYELMCEKP